MDTSDQFAKYNRDNLEVKLRDALFLVHPKAKDEAQQQLFDKIVNRELKTPYTWETELSALGQQKFESDELKQKAFREKWEELIYSGKLGYMALLRNLRNILQAGVSPKHVEYLCSRLSDSGQVLKSMQMPYRFLSAYREVVGVVSVSTSMVLEALEKAAIASIENVDGFDVNTKVLLASDVSGSMFHPVSSKGSVYNVDIGILLTSLLRSKCKSVQAGIFGDTWLPVTASTRPVLANTIDMKKYANRVGISTNGYKVLEWLIITKQVMDKVMMFTDCQMWDSTNCNKTFEDYWKHYKRIAPNAKLYLFDLSGYGQLPLRLVEPGVYLIAGWSDRVFDVLSAIEKGDNALDLINKIVI